MSTINIATRHLPPNLRDAILEVWKASNCMDLSYGAAAEYLKVAAQTFNTLRRDNAKLRTKMKRARAALSFS